MLLQVFCIYTYFQDYYMSKHSIHVLTLIPWLFDKNGITLETQVIAVKVEEVIFVNTIYTWHSVSLDQTSQSMWCGLKFGYIMPGCKWKATWKLMNPSPNNLGLKCCFYMSVFRLYNKGPMLIYRPNETIGGIPFANIKYNSNLLWKINWQVLAIHPCPI